MENRPTTLTGHLAHDLLHTLADLNRGDKLLGISSLLKSGGATKEWQSIRHPVGFAVLLVMQGILVYLIRHIVLRTAATLMVENKTRVHRSNSSSSSSSGGQANHGNIFGFLRLAVDSPRRLRRDVFLDLTYNILHSLFTNLLSGFFASTTWRFICHIIAVLVLSSLHLRWTWTILSLKRPARIKILSLPRKSLILPALVYGLAYRVTAKLPTHIADMASGYRGDEIGGIVFADSVVLVAAFALRMLVLYPAFAAYVYSEIMDMGRRDVGESGPSDGRGGAWGLGVDVYAKTVRLCFGNTAIWFGLLHLQMVVILAAFEVLVAPVVYRMIF
ncbi:hypothetical protein M436DRAFT_48871 [Aureobasidium namibiae CBS 147.97]|uniref:Uncharacterized protein n=1 Tax=Aureobasidium namibiae CBS 147.97 TaxID=1043004 RepID=A0A074WSD7_9PEZI